MSVEQGATLPDEVPAFFPSGHETLFGILTRPTEIGDSAAVFLRGGNQGPTAGRNGTSARLCRRLAEMGFCAFRFDYRGVGESTGYVERFHMDRPFVADLEDAVQWLHHQGIERTSLIGQCFGGRTALSLAPKLSGLRAIVLISPAVRDTEKDATGSTPLIDERGFSGFTRRAFRLHVFRGLLDKDRRRRYLRLVKGAWRGRRLTKRRSVVREGLQSDYWVSESFLSSLEEVLGRGIPVLFLWGTRDPGYEDFTRALTGRLGEIVRSRGSLVDVQILDGKVGSFAEARLQDRLIDLITGWLTRRRESDSDSVEPRPERIGGEK